MSVRVQLDAIRLGPQSNATRRALHAALSSDEQARCARFKFDHLQRDYATAHALLRSVLAAQRNVAASALRFVAGSHGRPALLDAPNDAASFNLSHTGGLALVATCAHGVVGVDIERRNTRDNTLDIAPRYFAPSEVDYVARAATAEQAEARFFRTWTLKEAYIKGRGLGLAIPLDAFWFRFDVSEETPPVEVDPARIDDPASRWVFRSFSIDDVPAALAVAHAGPIEVDLRWHDPETLASAL